MSRIKELKQHPDNNISMVDVFKVLCPEGKTKYIEFLLRLSKNTKHIERYVEEIRENFERELGVTRDKFEEMTPFQLYTAYRFLEMNFNFSDLKTFQKFCDYNERGLIKENDLSKLLFIPAWLYVRVRLLIPVFASSFKSANNAAFSPPPPQSPPPESTVL